MACVHNFTTNVLTPKEKKCLGNYSKKYITASARTTMRFSEFQQDAALGQLKQAQDRHASVIDKLKEIEVSMRQTVEARKK